MADNSKNRIVSIVLMVVGALGVAATLVVKLCGMGYYPWLSGVFAGILLGSCVAFLSFKGTNKKDKPHDR